MSDHSNTVTGSCLCGSIRYEISRFERGVVGCHCTQCRKTSGHFVAATKAMNDNLRMISDSTLKWYRSSEEAERGFCTECGGNLFWRKVGDDATSIMAGTLDGPTGLSMQSHIYVGDAGDYYHPDDGVPRHPKSDEDLTTN